MSLIRIEKRSLLGWRGRRNPSRALRALVTTALIIAAAVVVAPTLGESAVTTVSSSATVPSTPIAAGTRTFAFDSYHIYQQVSDTSQLDFTIDFGTAIAPFVVGDVAPLVAANTTALPRDDLSSYSTCFYDRPDVQAALAHPTSPEPAQGSIVVSLTNSAVGSPSLASAATYGGGANGIPAPPSGQGVRPARAIVNGLPSLALWPSYLDRILDVRILISGNAFTHGQLQFRGTFPRRTTIAVHGNVFTSELGTSNPTYFILNQVEIYQLTLSSPCAGLSIVSNTFYTMQGVGANTALPMLGDQGTGLVAAATLTNHVSNLNMRGVSLVSGATVAVVGNTMQTRGASQIANILISNVTSDAIQESALDYFTFENGTQIPSANTSMYTRASSTHTGCKANQGMIAAVLSSSSVSLNATVVALLRGSLQGCGSVQIAFNNLSAVTPETHLDGRNATFESGGSGAVGFSTYVGNLIVDGYVGATTYKITAPATAVTQAACSSILLDASKVVKTVFTVGGGGGGIIGSFSHNLWGSRPSPKSDPTSIAGRLDSASGSTNQPPASSGISASFNYLSIRSRLFTASPAPADAMGRRETYGAYVSRTAAFGITRAVSAMYHPLGPNATAIVVTYGTRLSLSGKNAGFVIKYNQFDVSQCPDAAAVFFSPQMITLRLGSCVSVISNAFVNIDAMRLVASTLASGSPDSSVASLPYVLANSGIARSFVSFAATPPRGGYGNASTLLEAVYLIYLKGLSGEVSGTNSRVEVSDNDFAPSPLSALGTADYVGVAARDILVPPTVTGNVTADRAIALIRGTGTLENRPGIQVTTIRSGTTFESAINFINGSFISVSGNNAVKGNGTSTLCFSVSISNCNYSSTPVFNALDVLRAYDLINVTTVTNVQAGVFKIPQDVLPKRLSTFVLEKTSAPLPLTVETLAPYAVNVSSIDLPAMTFVELSLDSSAINGGKIIVDANAVGIASHAVLDSYIIQLYTSRPTASRLSSAGTSLPNNITEAPITAISVTTQRLVVSSSFAHSSDIVSAADGKISGESAGVGALVTESVASDSQLNQTHWLNFTNIWGSDCAVGGSTSASANTSASTIFSMEDKVLIRWMSQKVSLFSVSGNLVYVLRGNTRKLVDVVLSAANVTGVTWIAGSKGMQRLQKGSAGATGSFVPLRQETTLRVPSAAIRVDGNVVKSCGTLLTTGVVEQEMIEGRRNNTLQSLTGSIAAKSRPVSFYVSGPVAVSQIGVVALWTESYSVDAARSDDSMFGGLPVASSIMTERLLHSAASLPVDVRTPLQTRRRDYVCTLLPTTNLTASITSQLNFSVGLTADTTMRFAEGGGLNQDTASLVANNIRDATAYSSHRPSTRFLSISQNVISQPNVQLQAYTNVTAMFDPLAELSLFVGFGALAVRSSGRVAGVNIRTLLPNTIAADGYAPYLTTTNPNPSSVASLTNSLCVATQVWDSAFAPSVYGSIQRVSDAAQAVSPSHVLQQEVMDTATVYYPATLSMRFKALVAPSVGFDRNTITLSTYRWQQGMIITSAESSGGSGVFPFETNFPTSYDTAVTGHLQDIFSGWSPSALYQLTERIPSLLPPALSLGDLDDAALLGGNTSFKLAALQSALHAVNRSGVSGDRDLLSILAPANPYNLSTAAAPSFVFSAILASIEDSGFAATGISTNLPATPSLSIANNSVNMFPCLGEGRCHNAGDPNYIPASFPSGAKFFRRLYGVRLDVEAKHVLFGSQLLSEGNNVVACIRKTDLEVVGLEFNANSRRRAAPTPTASQVASMSADTLAFVMMTAWSPTVLHHHSTLAMKWNLVNISMDYLYRTAIALSFQTALMATGPGGGSNIPGMINVSDSSRFLINSNDLKSFCVDAPSDTTAQPDSTTTGVYFSSITLTLIGETSVFLLGKNRVLVSSLGDFTQGVTFGTSFTGVPSVVVASGCPSNFARQTPNDPTSPMVATTPKILIAPRRYEPNIFTFDASIREQPPKTTPGIMVNVQTELALETKDGENRLLLNQRLVPFASAMLGPIDDAVHAERYYVCSGMYISGNDVKVTGTTFFFDEGSTAMLFIGTAQISNGAQLQITYSIFYFEDKHSAQNADLFKRPRSVRFGIVSGGAYTSSFSNEAGFHVHRNSFIMVAAVTSVPFTEMFLMPTSVSQPAALSLSLSYFGSSLYDAAMMLTGMTIDATDAMLGNIYFEVQCNMWNDEMVVAGDGNPGYAMSFPTPILTNGDKVTKMRPCVDTTTPTLSLSVSETLVSTDTLTATGNTESVTFPDTRTTSISASVLITDSVSVFHETRTLPFTDTVTAQVTSSNTIPPTPTHTATHSHPVTNTESPAPTPSRTFTDFDPGTENPCINITLRELLFGMVPILPYTPVTLRPTLSDEDITTADDRQAVSPLIPSNAAVKTYPEKVELSLTPFQTSYAWEFDLKTTDLFEYQIVPTPSGNVETLVRVQLGTAYYLLKNESFAFARLKPETVKSTTTSNNQNGFSGQRKVGTEDVKLPRVMITVLGSTNIDPPRESQVTAANGITYTGRTHVTTRLRIDFELASDYRIDVDEIMQIAIPTTSLMLMNTNKTTNSSASLQTTTTGAGRNFAEAEREFEVEATQATTNATTSAPVVKSYCQMLAPSDEVYIIWVRISPSSKTKLPQQTFMGALVGLGSGVLGVASIGNIAPAALGAELQLAIALLGFTRCSDPFTHRTLHNFSILSPFSLDSSFLGLIFGNAIAVAIVMLVQLAAFGFYRFHINVRSTSEILSRVRFPSVTFCVMTSFFTSFCFAAGFLIGEAPGYYLTGRVPEDEIASEGSSAFATAHGDFYTSYSPPTFAYIVFAVCGVSIVAFPIFLFYYAKYRITRAYQEYTVNEWADERRSRARYSKYEDTSTISLVVSVVCSCHMFSDRRKKWVAYRDKSKLLNAENKGGTYEVEAKFSDDDEGEDAGFLRRPSIATSRSLSIVSNHQAPVPKQEETAEVDDLEIDDLDIDDLDVDDIDLSGIGNSKPRADTIDGISEFMPKDTKPVADTIGLSESVSDKANAKGSKHMAGRSVSFMEPIDSSTPIPPPKKADGAEVEPTEIDKKMDTLIDRFHSNPFIVYFVIPQGAIYSADTRKAYGTFISGYRVYSHVWTTYPLWLGIAAFIFALILSQDSVTDSVGTCQAIFVAAGIILGFLAVYSLAIVSPKRSKGDTVLDALSKGLVGVILVFSAISAGGPATAQGNLPPYFIYLLFIILIAIVALRLILHMAMEAYDKLFESSNDAVLSIGLTTMWSHIPRQTAQVNKTFDILKDTSDNEDIADLEMSSGIRARFEEMFLEEGNGSHTPRESDGGGDFEVVVIVSPREETKAGRNPRNKVPINEKPTAVAEMDVEASDEPKTDSLSEDSIIVASPGKGRPNPTLSSSESLDVRVESPTPGPTAKSLLSQKLSKTPVGKLAAKKSVIVEPTSNSPQSPLSPKSSEKKLPITRRSIAKKSPPTHNKASIDEMDFEI